MRVAVVTAATAVCMAFAFYAIDVGAVGRALTGIEPHYAALAVILLLFNRIAAMARFRVLLAKFGYSPDRRRLFAAFSAGLLGNQFVLNVVGQSIGRAGILTTSGVPFGVTIVGTLVERTIAAGVLAITTLAVAWFLLPVFGFEFAHESTYFLSLFGGLTLAATAAVAVSYRRGAVTRTFVTAGRSVERFWLVVALTVLAHLFMLGGYIAALLALGLESATFETAGASLIVMFAAALPISLDGWGVRELSAVAVLGAVGIDPSTALSAALVVGVLSLGVNLAIAIPGLWLIPMRGRAVASDSGRVERPSNWNARLVMACGTLIAVTVFFQARLQGEYGLITANVADLFALVGLGSFILLVADSRERFAELPRELIGVLFAFSLLLAYGLVLGYVNFGANPWALINRGVGWLVILGYAAVGISTALLHTGQGSRLVLRLFVTVGATIATLQLLLLVALKLGFPPPAEAFRVPLRGYANDENAFALQMTVTSLAAIVAGRLGALGEGRGPLAAVLVLTGLAIYFSASRVGIGMFVMLLVLSIAFAKPDERRAALAMSALAMTGVVLVAVTIASLPVLSDAPGSGYAQIRMSVLDRIFDPDLRQTYVDGWNLWLERPIFGHGLGAYIERQLAESGQFQVSRSVPLWLMVEMGIVGAAVGLACLGRLLLCAYRMMRAPSHQAWGAGLLMALLCWGVANLLHDFLVQRSFWFFVGLGFALLPTARRAQRDRDGPGMIRAGGGSAAPETGRSVAPGTGRSGS